MTPLNAELDPNLVAFLEATTLLRLAEIHLDRSGPRLSSALLGTSIRLLSR